MNVGVKIGAGLVGAVVVFVAGYRYAAALYGKDIAALREDYAARAAALQEEYRAREKISTDSLRRAWEERDAAYADADARGAQFDDALRGLRHENDELRRRLSGAGEGAHLVEPRLQSAQDFSTRVQRFLLKVQEFASRTQQTSTPSEE